VNLILNYSTIDLRSATGRILEKLAELFPTVIPSSSCKV
jgi:hypothetical protein